MSRMYLAKSRWLESESTFEFHVIARDIATWYQDYFRFSDSITDTNDKAKDAINQQVQLYNDAFQKIAPAFQFYQNMKNEVVGPAMLIFGIILGIIGVAAVIYWIKKMRAEQDSAMFGMQSSTAERNDMMMRYYTQNSTEQSPSKFFQRIAAEEQAKHEEQ